MKSHGIETQPNENMKETAEQSTDCQYPARSDSGKKANILATAQVIFASCLALMAFVAHWWTLSDNQMQPVRIIATAFAAIGIVYAYRRRQPFTFLSLIILLFLYNLVMPFPWQSGSWARINGIASVLFFLNFMVFDESSQITQHTNLLEWIASWRITWIACAIILWQVVLPGDYQGLWESECRAGAELYSGARKQESYAAFISTSKKIGWLFGLFDADSLVSSLRSTAREAIENDDYVSAMRFYDFLFSLATRYAIHPLIEDYIGAAQASSALGKLQNAEQYLRLALSNQTSSSSLPTYLTKYSFPEALRIYQLNGISERFVTVPRIKPSQTTQASLLSDVLVDPSTLFDISVDTPSTEMLLVYLEQSEVFSMEHKYDEQKIAISTGKALAESILRNNPKPGIGRFAAAHNLAVYLNEAARVHSITSNADETEGILLEAISVSKRVGDWEEATCCDTKIVAFYEQQGRFKEALSIQKEIDILKDKKHEQGKS